MSSAAPFFIVGCSRSGTTLLQTLLDAHPNLAIPPESQIYERFSPIFHTYGDLHQAGNRRRLIHDLLNDAYIRHWKLGISVAEVESLLTTPSRAAIIATLFKLYAQRKGAARWGAARWGAARWGDKTPEHVRHLAKIREDFPDARLIHLIRDGRDTAEALRRMTWAPVTAVGLAREWRREVFAWRNFCAQAGTAHTLIVRYEDLVLQPASVIKTILEFLDEPFIDTTQNYASTELSRSLDARSAHHGSLRKGIDAAKIGAYRQKFTAREIEIIENIAGDALTAYGYPLDYREPRAPSAWDRCKAPLVDRLVRWYRKLFMPRAFIWDLQRRSRSLMRRL